MDNVIVRKGIATFTAAFTPPVAPDFTDDKIVLGLTGETPFICSTTETYAKFTGQTISSATAKKIDYDSKRVIIEDVDLGRDEHRRCATQIEQNDKWISETAVAMMKAKFPDFVIRGDDPATNNYLGTYFCLRDTEEYIIDAIIKDLKYGGNYYTTVAAKGYLTATGGLDFVNKELLQTLYTWQKVGEIINFAITTTSTDLEKYENVKYTDRLRVPNNFSSPASSNVQNEVTALVDGILNILGPTGARYRDAGDAMWQNRDFIAEEVAAYIPVSYTNLTLPTILRV